MNISSISANSSMRFSPLNNNKEIELLEKQKVQLQEQIQKINESKTDSKTKQEKIKQLQDQIQQIETRIQQKQNEKLNRQHNTDKANKKKQPSNVEQSSTSFSGMTQLIDADITYSKAKIMNKVKNNLNGKSKILKKEIEIDESRSLSGSKASAKRKELQEIEFKKQTLEKEVGKINKTAQEQVGQTKNEEIENNNKDKDDKNNDDKNKNSKTVS